MSAEEELYKKQRELSECYRTVANYYIRMSKVNDAYSCRVIQSGIDTQLQLATLLKERTGELKKEMMQEWKETGANKTIHE